MGSALKRPPGQMKSKAAKAAATKYQKKLGVAHVGPSLGNEYVKLVESSCTIADSIRFKT
jgi:hypothetical protein